MRAAISLVLTLAAISLGLGIVATFIPGAWPGWFNLLCFGIALVLGGAGLAWVFMDKRRSVS